jgi:SAM-dependent methyltransferase
MSAGFAPVERCWVCGGESLAPFYEARYELSAFATQDPPLAAYSGQSIDIRRCAACGFAQPAALPALDRYFDRIYDQHWAEYWVEAEHTATYKDDIFAGVLRALQARVTATPPASAQAAAVRRRLLDVGAHAGRLMSLARREGWDVEGIELNPRTAAQAAASTGAVVHQGNIFTVEPSGPFDAISLVDVLEHIPEPLRALTRAADWIRAGGAIAVKVPNGAAQRLKESVRAFVRPGYRPTLADNLVHVNHFTPRSLRLALERSGFTGVRVTAAAPEMPDGRALDRAMRRAVFAAARLPGGLHTPLGLNLLAIATRV